MNENVPIYHSTTHDRRVFADALGSIRVFILWERSINLYVVSSNGFFLFHFHSSVRRSHERFDARNSIVVWNGPTYKIGYCIAYSMVCSTIWVIHVMYNIILIGVYLVIFWNDGTKVKTKNEKKPKDRRTSNMWW